ncbi:MAG: hypothetical protein J6S14_17190 [Clostridia bacterium]|nr:hypothetical protein [Clostridia bacterium]
MTVAEKILEWITSLGNVLTRANAKIAAKNGTTADTIFDLPDAIDTVQTGADVSGVTAGAGDVLFGKTIVDALGGEVHGTMKNNGAVKKTLTSNTSYTIPAGYHNGSGKVTADVPQTIVTGEDSTDCTAVASDVRYGKSFRAGGIEDTGELRTVSVPKVVIDVDTTSSSSNVQVKAYTNASTTEGILPAGSSGSTVSKTIPKYTGETSFLVTTGSKTIQVSGRYCEDNIILTGAPTYSGSYTVTPTSSAQTLYTAGNYLSNNIIIQSAAPVIHAVIGSWSSKSSVTIQEITEMPQMFMLHHSSSSGYATLTVLDVDFSVISSGSSKAYEVITSVSIEWSGFESRSYGSGVYTSGTVIKDSDGMVNISLSSSGLTLTSSNYVFDGTYTIFWM